MAPPAAMRRRPDTLPPMAMVPPAAACDWPSCNATMIPAMAPPRSPMALPRVVVVGGGFGGLYAVRALKHADVAVTLVDRSNHHLFQPLLYQVATAALSPAHIAVALRRVLRRQRNVAVVMAEAAAID